MNERKTRRPTRNEKLEEHMLQRARSLRQSETAPERMLWNALRHSSLLNVKFRRQHAIGPYVADFCCCQRKLLIELDGDTHDFTEEQDARRTEFLKSQGYTVIRFSNDDVIYHRDAVLAAIERELMNTEKPGV